MVVNGLQGHKHETFSLGGFGRFRGGFLSGQLRQHQHRQQGGFNKSHLGHLRYFSLYHSKVFR